MRIRWDIVKCSVKAVVGKPVHRRLRTCSAAPIKLKDGLVVKFLLPFCNSKLLLFSSPLLGSVPNRFEQGSTLLGKLGAETFGGADFEELKEAAFHHLNRFLDGQKISTKLFRVNEFRFPCSLLNCA